MKLRYIILALIVAVCMTFGAYAEETVDTGATAVTRPDEVAGAEETVETQEPYQPSESMIGVGLFYASTAKDAVNISADGGLLDDMGNYLGTSMVAALLEDGNVVLYSAENGYAVIWGEGGNQLRLRPVYGTFDVDGKIYRGNIIFRPYEGKITVINEIELDDYVCGVVSGEMPSSWHQEALKAQAVAARCFALRALDKHSKYGFDVCSTTNCQVYGGVASETESTNKAVRDTAGIVAVYNGKVVNTLFSSSNGGYMEGSENVWGGKEPYFQTVKDEYERTEEISSANWTYEISPEEIKAELADSGVDIGDIVNMEVISTSESGRVLEVKITGTAGEKSYTKSYARTFLGLRSQLYTITAPGNPVYCLGAEGLVTVKGEYHILTAEGLDVRTTGSGNGNYVIEGKGYGHGVGMSQWGARHMSEQGFKYDEILKYYFKGAEIAVYDGSMS